MDLVTVIASVSRRSLSSSELDEIAADDRHLFRSSVEERTYAASPYMWCLGSIAFNKYYRKLFSGSIRCSSARYLSKVFLNFAVQQLATRSYVNPQNERYLQVGSFRDDDFAAALVGGMPHTRAFYLGEWGSGSNSGAQDVLNRTRSELACDDLASAEIVVARVDEWLGSQPDASFGAICLVGAAGAVALKNCVDEFGRLLNPGGRLLILQQAQRDETPEYGLGLGWMVEITKSFFEPDQCVAGLSATIARVAKEVKPIGVRDWAPRNIQCGVGANVQFDGSSAMWLRTDHYDAETVSIFVAFGEGRIERKAVVSPCLLTCQIPAEIVTSRGSYGVYLRQFAGSLLLREDFVGSLEVL